MTQNKKFKKLVRARMEKTGETYMQARRALDEGRETAPKPIEIEGIRKRLHRTWHQVYASGKSFGYHIYEDGPEDGRVHTSLCGEATTKTWETKTPGGPHCEKCKLLKVKEILERQKIVGDPLNLLHDAEGWAAAGGDEAERIATRDEMWGMPPDEGRDIPALRKLLTKPSVLEIDTPFPVGWYWHHTEYPDEGCAGPYGSRQEAVQGACEDDIGVGLSVESVASFWEQKTPARIRHRYPWEYPAWELEEALSNSSFDLWEHLKKFVTDSFMLRCEEMKREGLRVPSSEEMSFRFGVFDDGQTLRAMVRIAEPNRYPDFTRALTDSGIMKRDGSEILSVEIRDEAS